MGVYHSGHSIHHCFDRKQLFNGGLVKTDIESNKGA